MKKFKNCFAVVGSALLGLPVLAQEASENAFDPKTDSATSIASGMKTAIDSYWDSASDSIVGILAVAGTVVLLFLAWRVVKRATNKV